MHVLILNGNPMRFIAQKMIFGRTMIFIAVMQKGEPMDEVVSKQAVYDALDNIKIPRNASWYQYYHQALTAVSKLPPVQPDFDITVKINKAYDDGYEAGYLQGRHDWGDWDE